MNNDIIRAVRNMLSSAEDNLARARAAFRGLGAADMQSAYGQSGESRVDILSGYEQDVARWRRALADALSTKDQ